MVQLIGSECKIEQLVSKNVLVGPKRSVEYSKPLPSELLIIALLAHCRPPFHFRSQRMYLIVGHSFSYYEIDLRG